MLGAVGVEEGQRDGFDSRVVCYALGGFGEGEVLLRDGEGVHGHRDRGALATDDEFILVCA